MAICFTIIQFSNLFLRIIWIFDLDFVWGMQFWQSVGTEECKSSQLFLSTGRKKYFCCGRNCSQNTDPGLSSLWSWSSKVSQACKGKASWFKRLFGFQQNMCSGLLLCYNVVFKADCCQHWLDTDQTVLMWNEPSTDSCSTDVVPWSYKWTDGIRYGYLWVGWAGEV